MGGKLYFALCFAFLHTTMQLPATIQPANGVSRTAKTTPAPLKSSDVLYYPGDVVVSPNLANAQNRTPIYQPGKCSKNEILYPGDQGSDWVCDCKPGYVYYPQKDECYELYTRGYCQADEYVDLKRPAMLVTCTKNPCPYEDNKMKVPFREGCVELGSHDIMCKNKKGKQFIVGVNTTTLELDCIEGTKKPIFVDVESRFDKDDDDEVTTLAPLDMTVSVGANRGERP